MWTERFPAEVGQSEQEPSAFVAIPMLCVGFANPAALQQQLYSFALEQARRSIVERQRSSPRELFAIMN